MRRVGFPVRVRAADRSGRGGREALALLVVGFLAASSARAQLFTSLFSENFEAPGSPPGMVGAYAEFDPLLPGFAPTLWHAEGFCAFAPTIGYAGAPSATPFASIAANPASVLLWGAGGNDNGSGFIPLPAPFTFFGAAKTNLRVNNNGFLLFGGTGSVAGFSSNLPIPDAQAPNDVVFAWWDDLVVRPGGFVRTLVTAANDLVVEWNGEERVPANSGTERASFQVILRASPPDAIEIVYDHAGFVSSSTNPWDATVGLEDVNSLTSVDLTGLGAANSAFPGASLLLTPLPAAPPPVPASMGSAAAAYNQGDVGLYTYDTGFANAGALVSPPIASTSASAAVFLVFETTKEVQPGAGTSFDRAFVEAAPAGSASWSSLGDVGPVPPCTGPPQTMVRQLPPSFAGTVFQHRFRFDTVDNGANGFRGWYVDNVRVEEVFAITNVAFDEPFESGTVPGSTVGSMTEINPSSALPADTLWHAETQCDGGGTPFPAPITGTAAAYHQGDQGTYNFATGGTSNRGAIHSPLFSIPAGTNAFAASFDYVKETEGNGSGSFDQCFLESRPTGTGAWTTLVQVTGNQPCGAAGSVVLSGGSGLDVLQAAGTGQLRLRFDTVDGVGNNFLGWVVDNLRLLGQSVLTSLPFGNGCAGAGGCVPAIGIAGAAVVGNPSFRFTLSSVEAGTSAFLVLGTSSQSPPCSLPLPFPFGGVLPGNACSLLVCPDAILPPIPVSPGAACGGTAAFVVPIPPNAPPGAFVVAQWIVLNAAAIPAPTFVSASAAHFVLLL